MIPAIFGIFMLFAMPVTTNAQYSNYNHNQNNYQNNYGWGHGGGNYGGYNHHNDNYYNPCCAYSYQPVYPTYYYSAPIVYSYPVYSYYPVYPAYSYSYNYYW